MVRQPSLMAMLLCWKTRMWFAYLPLLLLMMIVRLAFFDVCASGSASSGWRQHRCQLRCQCCLRFIFAHGNALLSLRQLVATTYLQYLCKIVRDSIHSLRSSRWRSSETSSRPSGNVQVGGCCQHWQPVEWGFQIRSSAFFAYQTTHKAKAAWKKLVFSNISANAAQIQFLKRQKG